MSDQREDTGRQTGAEAEASRLARAAEQARHALERTREGMAAAGSGLVETTKEAFDTTRGVVGRAAEIVRESEPDVELKQTVSSTTERSLHGAGDRVSGAAPAIGRGAEAAAEAVASALHIVARPLAVILGAIAGTVGGWWRTASESMPDLPREEEQVCQAHFTTVTVLSPGMSFEQARPGYALGYIAARNPDYRGRAFEEVEPDLRHGFTDPGVDYDSLREFARYGYGRGTGTA
jgi:hypothetical protein